MNSFILCTCPMVLHSCHRWAVGKLCTWKLLLEMELSARSSQEAWGIGLALPMSYSMFLLASLAAKCGQQCQQLWGHQALTRSAWDWKHELPIHQPWVSGETHLCHLWGQILRYGSPEMEFQRRVPSSAPCVYSTQWNEKTLYSGSVGPGAEL